MGEWTSDTSPGSGFETISNIGWKVAHNPPNCKWGSGSNIGEIKSSRWPAYPLKAMIQNRFPLLAGTSLDASLVLDQLLILFMLLVQIMHLNVLLELSNY